MAQQKVTTNTATHHTHGIHCQLLTSASYNNNDTNRSITTHNCSGLYHQSSTSALYNNNDNSSVSEDPYYRSLSSSI